MITQRHENSQRQELLINLQQDGELIYEKQIMYVFLGNFH